MGWGRILGRYSVVPGFRHTPIRRLLTTIQMALATLPRDISLGTGLWTGAVSSGGIVWFVRQAIDTAVAYNASDGSRNAATRH